MNYSSKLVLKSGKVFQGFANASKSEAIGEVIFNTSMVGYQEIATDPGYYGKIVLMTYPLIGNYGVNDEDNESKGIKIAGFIVKEYNDLPSNFRFTKTLAEMFDEANTPILSGFDTRELSNYLRDNGTELGIIANINTPLEECMAKLNSYAENKNLVKEVSTKKRWISRAKNPKFHVVCLDLGTKTSVIKELNDLKCNVTVVPYTTSYKEIMELEPSGLLISNGPGNPANYNEIVELIKTASGNIPMMGINLGHQLIALANGAKIDKTKFGHNSTNHAIKNLDTAKLQIVSQTNQYTVNADSIKNTELEITYMDLQDKTIEGLKNVKNSITTVQFNPDYVLSPLNAEEVFGAFIENMKNFKGGKNNA